jgi:hypothetical protein
MANHIKMRQFFALVGIGSTFSPLPSANTGRTDTFLSSLLVCHLCVWQVMAQHILADGGGGGYKREFFKADFIAIL